MFSGDEERVSRKISLGLRFRLASFERRYDRRPGFRRQTHSPLSFSRQTPQHPINRLVDDGRDDSFQRRVVLRYRIPSTIIFDIIGDAEEQSDDRRRRKRRRRRRRSRRCRVPFRRQSSGDDADYATRIGAAKDSVDVDQQIQRPTTGR